MTEEKTFTWDTKGDCKQAEEYEKAIKEEIIDKIRLHLKFGVNADINSIIEAIK